MIANETTMTSRIHFDGTGNAFVRFVDSGTDDDWTWLSERWNDAYSVVRVFRFLKYATVDLDWGGMHFSPEWVNKVRKYGLSIIGRPRWDIQPQRFILEAGDHERLLQYFEFYTAHATELDDMRSHLRKATAIAGNYYEGHHARTAAEDKLIDLVISLEAMFSPGLEGEMRFRIAQRAALLLGAHADGRRQMFKFIRRAYDARSFLVHGGESPFQTAKFAVAEIAELGEAVRVAILRLLTLWFRGQTSRDDVLAWIDDAALDQARHHHLREQSDFERYLKGQQRSVQT